MGPLVESALVELTNDWFCSRLPQGTPPQLADSYFVGPRRMCFP
jgi:hypothetical protein